jgi:hypothetical protein
LKLIKFGGNRVNKLIFLICGVLITMSPTLSFAKVSKKVWCKDRYLNQVEQKYGTIYTPTEEIVAEKGYIYSTLGAIALQKDNKPNADYTFVLPNNVEQIDHISAENSEPAKKVVLKQELLLLRMKFQNVQRNWLLHSQVQIS